MSNENNLAYACLRCNAWKGNDLASLDPAPRQLTALFHPRREPWQSHFILAGMLIEPLTATGRATTRLLKLNIAQRVMERQALLAAGRYPRRWP